MQTLECTSDFSFNFLYVQDHFTEAVSYLDIEIFGVL